MTTIRRQKPEAFRQVVELAAAKQTDKAFAKLVELGAVTEAPADGHDSQLYQRAADAYVSATKQGKSALLVSPTWAEIDAVTEKVRSKLKADGAIGQHEEAVTVFDSLSWTNAQKKNVRQYEPGQRLRFVRKTKRFERGETVEVTDILKSSLRVRRADGTELDFIPANGSACFDVGEVRVLKVAAGDWLLLQANAVAVRQHFINGERVQVRQIQNDRITLADGRTLPAGFNTFTHGYAVTSHSSQGKTVDEVLLVASSRSFPAVNREQFYVSISRGRERVQIFTDDTELLARRVTDSHERKAAIELQDLRDELVKLGFIRRDSGRSITPAMTIHQDFRAARPFRSIRPSRFTRLFVVQRLAQMVAQLNRWLDERMAVESKKSVGEKIEPAQFAKQTEKVAPAKTVKPMVKIEQAESVKPAKFIKRRTTLEELRQRLAEQRKLRQGMNQRHNPGHSRSGGIHM